jgi:hypothetical protein
MKRIGPQNPGVARPRAARLALLVILAFYAAGLTLMVLYYGFGTSPTSLRH